MVDYGTPAYDKPPVQCKPSPKDSAHCMGKFDQVDERGSALGLYGSACGSYITHPAGAPACIDGTVWNAMIYECVRKLKVCFAILAELK